MDRSPQNRSTSQEGDDTQNLVKKSNPIIFARSETTHIPQPLKTAEYHVKLKDAIYSAKEDGSLKLTPMPSIVETDNEGDDVQTIHKHGFWTNFLYYVCCLGSLLNNQNLEEVASRSLVPAKSTKSPDESNISITPAEPFLGVQRDRDKGKKTLVLDLDETLVHSTFQQTKKCQYVISVTIEGNQYSVYVYQRPGALKFIRKMSEIYEVIVYTASLQIYADPLLDQMDPDHCISARLFRDHCVCSDGFFVKDLGLLGRDLKSVIMVDNAAMSYKFQPRNGMECIPFIDDCEDTELEEMTPFLEYLSKKDDVRLFVKMWNDSKENRIRVISGGK